jgi:hypothetical protein
LTFNNRVQQTLHVLQHKNNFCMRKSKTFPFPQIFSVFHVFESVYANV